MNRMRKRPFAINVPTLLNPSLAKSPNHTLWGTVSGPPKGLSPQEMFVGSNTYPQGMTGRLVEKKKSSQGLSSKSATSLTNIDPTGVEPLVHIAKKACFAARAQCVPWAKMATVPTYSLQKYTSDPLNHTRKMISLETSKPSTPHSAI